MRLAKKSDVRELDETSLPQEAQRRNLSRLLVVIWKRAFLAYAPTGGREGMTEASKRSTPYRAALEKHRRSSEPRVVRTTLAVQPHVLGCQLLKIESTNAFADAASARSSLLLLCRLTAEYYYTPKEIRIIYGCRIGISLSRSCSLCRARQRKPIESE